MDMSQSHPWRYMIINGAIASVYFATATLTLSVLSLGAEASPIWPPAGIALAALVLGGRQYWPGVALGSMWLNQSFEVPLLLSLFSVLGTTLQASLGATLLLRFKFRPTLERLRDALGFILLAVNLAPLTNATIGSAANWLWADMPARQLAINWWTTWLGDSTGILVIAPLLLVLWPRLVLHRPWPRFLASGLYFLPLVIVSALVFLSATPVRLAHYPLDFLPLPLVVWIALRLGQRGTVIASFLLSAVAIGGTVVGYGPFAAKAADGAHAIMLLQTFMGVTAATTLVLTAAVTERQRTEALLRRSEASLSNAQRIAQLGNWDYDPTQQQWRWSDELYRLLGFVPQIFPPGQMAFLRAVHPTDRARVETALENALQHGIPYAIDYRIVLPDGSERIVHEQTVVEATAITGTVQDITAYKQAEAALQQSENKNRALLNAIPDLIFRISREGKYLDFRGEMSDPIMATSSLSQDDVVGKYMSDLLPPDVVEIGLRAVRIALESGQPQVCEYQLMKPSGICEYESRLVVCGPDEVFAIVRDITDRKRVETALRESEEKFSKAFCSSPDSMTISNLEDGRYIDVNDTFLKVTGYTRDEVIGRTAAELNIWADLLDRQRLKHLLHEHGSLQNQEFRFCRKSGEVVTALVSTEIIALRGESCLLCVTRDITERKQAEEKLQISAERDRLLGKMALQIRQSLELETILNTTVAEVRQFLQADRVFITRFDDQGLGLVMAEAVAQGWDSVVGDVTDGEIYQQVDALFRSHRIHIVNNTTEGENPAFLRDYYACYQIKASLAVPIVLGDRLFGLLVANQCSEPRVWQSLEIDLLDQLATQVTIAVQQAQLYQQVQRLNTSLEQQVQDRTLELQQRMQELQDLNQLRDVFLHTVSHDLRTTVMGTLLCLKNLQQQSGETVAISRIILERMIDGGEQQLNKLNALLDAYASKTQGVVLHQEQIPLRMLLQGAIATVEPQVIKNQATISNLVPTGLPLLTADPVQLQRVFEHLLTNALKHNPPHVQVRVKASIEADRLYCCIEDDGVGIAPEQRDRLFELCIGDAKNRQLTGLGLGLYLCRQIIKAHGGDVGVVSHPGQGTTFWFSLPLLPSPAGKMSAPHQCHHHLHEE